MQFCAGMFTFASVYIVTFTTMYGCFNIILSKLAKEHMSYFIVSRFPEIILSRLLIWYSYNCVGAWEPLKSLSLISVYSVNFAAAVVRYLLITINPVIAILSRRLKVIRLKQVMNVDYVKEKDFR